MKLRALAFALAAAAISTFVAFVGARYAVTWIERDTVERISISMAAAGQDWALVRADGLQVHLEGIAPSENARFRAIEVAGQLVDTRRIQEDIDVRTETTAAAPEFSLEIIRNSRALSLIGIVPGQGARDAVLRQLMTSDSDLTDLLETVEGRVPKGWEEAFDFALEAATELPRSRIAVKPGRVELEAFLDDGIDEVALRQTLEGRLKEGIALDMVLMRPRPVVAPFTFDATLDAGSLRLATCHVANEQDATVIAARITELGGADATCKIALGAPSDGWATAVLASINALDALDGGRVRIADADIVLTSGVGVAEETFETSIAQLEAALPALFSLDASRPTPPMDTEAAADAPPRPSAPRLTRMRAW